jgi:hypothetical protein
VRRDSARSSWRRNAGAAGAVLLVAFVVAWKVTRDPRLALEGALMLAALLFAALAVAGREGTGPP